MGTLDDMIALATRHVAESRRIVERQRKLVVEKRGGPDGLELLKTFERPRRYSSAIWIGYLASATRRLVSNQVGGLFHSRNGPSYWKESWGRLLPVGGLGG